MSAPIDHLPVLPIVLPLALGAAMLLIDENRHRVKAAWSMLGTLALVAVALLLLARVETPVTQVYPIGNWPAPFGIALVADRLGALMVLLAALLGLAALAFSLARWHRFGPHFHTLLQLLLAGLNGAFLTGDLFNLFVFFELLLAASYGLALYGGGVPRVQSSLHYVAVNLTASLLFLIGVSLIYGVAGTLNMADLAVRVPSIAAEDLVLFEIGAAALGVAFLVKAGMWPLGFWLVPAYSAASAPAAALFAILSKVGVYAVLRVWLLVFGGADEEALLIYGGMATLLYGFVGVLAAQELARIAGYSLFISSGTLLAAIGMGGVATMGAALYYLVASTLGIAAFFLLVELIERAREPGADVLAVTAQAFGLAGEEPEEEVGVIIPATRAVLGISFACCALVIAGLPPLPGFIGKFAILASLLGVDPVPQTAWWMLALLVVSGLAATIALARAGIRVFWVRPERDMPRVRVIEIAPVAVLLLACIALTIWAAPAMRYMEDAARTVQAPAPYVEEVIPAK
ncbi:MAG TPA: monovalent cation/H+ antiporter subunit D [Burkholderiales bacterium]|nr:monovalent cation/H+ antiporter subunit D [Burkholderiales bacterium]